MKMYRERSADDSRRRVYRSPVKASCWRKPGVSRSQYRFAGVFSHKLRLTLDYTQGCRLGVPRAERG